MAKKRVLIVCTGNACRSQMAEALWRAEAGDEYEVASAGTHPAGVHPLARQVIEELGIDMSSHRSKSVYSFADESFDMVVTVCNSAREICPTFPRAKRLLHWPFPDPISAVGDLDERLAEFRGIRDIIRAKIRDFVASERFQVAPPVPTC
jgi:arsenate reductase